MSIWQRLRGWLTSSTTVSRPNDWDGQPSAWSETIAFTAPTGAPYEIEFRYLEEVIYWEGRKGCIFPSGWGVDPAVTNVPDAETWDHAVPEFLRGRHDEVVERLRADERHVLQEERDDSLIIRRYRETSR